MIIMPIAEQPPAGKTAADFKKKKKQPALEKRLTTVALSGALPLQKETIICSSQFVHAAEEQATISIDLPEGPGSYLLVPTTYFPNQECQFSLTLYHTDPALTLVPLKGARLPPKLDAKGNKGESKGSGKMGPPIAKHDVAATRAAGAAPKADGTKDELGDDGKMGYAQRMEMEEAMRLSKHPENVPLFTVEGAPLSDNVKKDMADKVAKALAYCREHGTKFEDSGGPDAVDRRGGFPRATGNAAGSHQPECYPKGRSGSLPEVVEWRRPEEFPEADRPVMFRNDYSVEGIIQGAGFDNRWFISAMNIVSGNRGQLDRLFFGELCDEWIDNGFFVCKFYQDDPQSDDDWQVGRLSPHLTSPRLTSPHHLSPHHLSSSRLPLTFLSPSYRPSHLLTCSPLLPLHLISPPPAPPHLLSPPPPAPPHPPGRSSWSTIASLAVPTAAPSSPRTPTQMSTGR